MDFFYKIGFLKNMTYFYSRAREIFRKKTPTISNRWYKTTTHSIKFDWKCHTPLVIRLPSTSDLGAAGDLETGKDTKNEANPLLNVKLHINFRTLVCILPLEGLFLLYQLLTKKLWILPFY